VRRKKNLRLSDVVWLVKVTTGRSLSEATISRLERGQIDSSAATKAAIARALKVPSEQLWST
jgi:transcriptional regulator with XRE-family HTH domain